MAARLWQRDGGGLIDYEQLRLRQQRSVLRQHVLDRLPVVAVDVDAHDSGAQLGVGRLDEREVSVLLVVERIAAASKEREGTIRGSTEISGVHLLFVLHRHN